MVQKVRDGQEEQQPILERTNSQSSTPNYSLINEAYRNHLNGLTIDPSDINSLPQALYLLEFTIKSHNIPLTDHCISTIRKFINKDYALKVLMTTSKLLYTTPEAPRGPSSEFAPSAPPLIENGDETWVKEPLRLLLEDCLLEIDKNADFVLNQKEILDLKQTQLLAITSRDTLKVSSELLVYSAVVRWAFEECKRRKKEPEAINLKIVMGNLVYAPRYGLMLKKEFLIKTIDDVKGPDSIGILSETEINKILDSIKQKEKKKKCKEELPHKMSVPRKTSTQIVEENKNALRDKIIINCLTCLTAILD